MCDALQLNWKLNSTASSSRSRDKKTNYRLVEDRGDDDDDDDDEFDDQSKAYTLRACSIKKRIDTEQKKAQPKKRGPKPRPKSAPMSKYRRKTANLRERQRMGEINNAFERLRERIPNPVLSGRGKCEKLTKINILHVTINYIRAMENLLATGDPGMRSFSDMVRNPLRPDEKPVSKFDNVKLVDEDEEDEMSEEKVNSCAKQDNEASYIKTAAKSPQGPISTCSSSSSSSSSPNQYILPPNSNNPIFRASAVKRTLFGDNSDDSGVSSISSSPSFLNDMSTTTSSAFLTNPNATMMERNNNGSKTDCGVRSILEDVNVDPMLANPSCWSNQPNSKSTNAMFDMSLSDDMLKEVVGLVAQLQDEDFPDIPLDDSFDLFTKS